MIYFCCDDQRRNAVNATAGLNGIDFLEVFDPGQPHPDRQRILFVHFLKGVPSPPSDLKNLRITGGERIPNVSVVSAELQSADSKVLVVRVSEPGDYSRYTLRLVADVATDDPPAGFDPILSAVDFSFKVACPSDLDCQPASGCPPGEQRQPQIDYLAKDYASFRQLMLDCMAVVAPKWKERSPADLGIVLVELAAAVGDYLSYRQDAVATEAYLGTARLRSSVRRHARLVDYFMHDGANARAWIQLQMRGDIHGLPIGSPARFLTQVSRVPTVLRTASADEEKAMRAFPEVFELMRGAVLDADHNRMLFHTWGALLCCLPKGALKATLRGNLANLVQGAVLILAEHRGPETGTEADADPSHRHAVMLTRVRPGLTDPVGNTPITEIEWGEEDALPFPLCVSSRVGTRIFDDTGVAYGNIVLADHGMTIERELLAAVPQHNPALRLSAPSGHCGDQEAEQKPARFRPKLMNAQVTQAMRAGLPQSAAQAVKNDPREALPSVHLSLASGGPDLWRPQRDLLASDDDSREFVVEVENDGAAYLRFGDDQFGARPAAGTEFAATYRTGNGTRGNTGAGTIVHLISADGALVSDIDDPVVTRVTNWLPASGGVDPETIEEVRQYAPAAFRKQDRAITPGDYEEAAKRASNDVQRAAATFRWTGSWRTVFLTIDRLGGRKIDTAFEKDLVRSLDTQRMAGVDLEVDDPIPVSLDIEMEICVKPGYQPADVKRALREIFSSRTFADGRCGLFHPDKFTFGQTVFLSVLYAAALSVEGVASVTFVKFQRQGRESREGIDSGKLDMQRLEIARLDNDPNFPERGVFTVRVKGEAGR